MLVLFRPESDSMTGPKCPPMRTLPAKNTLVEADAAQVEEAFERMVSTLVAAETAGGALTKAQSGNESAPSLVPASPESVTPPTQVPAKELPEDEGSLAIAKPWRYRNKDTCASSPGRPA